MKKRLLSMLLVGAMAMSLAACGGDTAGKDADQKPAAGDTADTAGSSQKNYKIALCMSHQTNEFTTAVGKGAKEKAAELGVTVEVFDGKQDQATQINQIETAINQGYDGILVEPISADGIVPAVKSANEAGVPVITVVQQMKNQDTMAASYCGGDEAAASKLEMQKAVDAIDGKGNIVIIYGPMGSDAQLKRKAGYDEILAQNPDVTVVYQETANWVTEEALTLMENWLSTGKEINAVVSQNDSMAMGALKAIEDAGKQADIPVFGLDAVSDAVKAVADGRLAGTVSQDAPGQGALGVETMVKVLNGEDVEPINYTECVWVNKDNVADYQ
ncbi:sugar ABC transporter substrate-binding protein [Intestinibacillus massiliensis]|nr:sugar ABC transporter substrate-binding protein [Intestinibacillus massiliensis]